MKLAKPGLVFAMALMRVEVCNAFEQGGFHSGITFAEAKKLSETYGTPLKPMRGPTKDTYTVGPPDANNGVVQFCNGRLYFVSQNIAGGVDAFAESAERFSRLYGAPTVTASSGHTKDGLVSYVSLTWQVQLGEEVAVTISSWQQNVITNVFSSAFEKYCK